MPRPGSGPIPAPASPREWKRDLAAEQRVARALSKPEQFAITNHQVTLRGCGPRAKQPLSTEASVLVIRQQCVGVVPLTDALAVTQNVRRSPPPLPRARKEVSEAFDVARASGGYARPPQQAPMPERAQTLAEQPAAGPASVDELALLREQTLRAYREGESLSNVLQAAPARTWAAFGVLCLLIVSALIVSAVCSVSLVGRAVGVLRHPGGSRIVAAAIAGRIEHVSVPVGAVVGTGDELLRVDSSQLRAQLLQAEQRVRQAAQRLETMRSVDKRLFDDTLAVLRQDLRLNELRVRSQQLSLHELMERGASVRDLSERGFVSRTTDMELTERLREAERNRIALRQQASQNRLMMVSLTRDRLSQLNAAENEHAAAESARAAIELLIAQSTLRAPQAGRIEAVSAKPGDLVEPGVPLLRLVPLDPPSQVIAFIPDADRAFVRPGAAVRVEVAQLPSGEFGTLRGRVQRTASTFASAEELRDVLGDQVAVQGPSYRIEISLDGDPHTRQLLGRLQSGASIIARVALRQRRIITLVFEPLRRLLE